MTRRWGLVIVVMALLAPGCGGSDSSNTTAADMTRGPIDPSDPNAPTSEALAANEGFLVLPPGLADCGETVLTSGWPTTTVFTPETQLACLNDAIAASTPSQYAYWGRDGEGGIAGVVIRVGETGPLTFIDYTVDDAGNVASNEQACDSLRSDVAQPPQCVPAAVPGDSDVGSTTPGRSSGDHSSRDHSGQKPPTTGNH